MGKKAIAPAPTQWLYNYIVPTETRLKNNFSLHRINIHISIQTHKKISDTKD